VFFPFQQFGADLMDTSSVRKQNNNVSFVLLCIDNFSKMLYYSYLHSKQATEVEKGLKRIFKKAGRTPEALLVDDGKVCKYFFD
jgi:hypothetical protein